MQGKLTNNSKDIATIQGNISINKGRLDEFVAQRESILANIDSANANLRTLKLSLPKYQD